MKTRSFTNRRIWTEAHRLALAVYEVTRGSPKEGSFGLTMQIRRSAVPVAANIAEGAGRRTSNDLIRFLHQARGSLNETICHCLIAGFLGYLGRQKTAELVGRHDGLGAGIHACIRGVESRKVPTAGR